MNKRIILDQLEDNLKIKLNQNPEEKKLQLIKKILKEESWYLKIELDMFLDILDNLGYEKKEALKIYKELLKG